MDFYKLLHKSVVANLSKAGIHEYQTHYLQTKNLNENSILIDLGANEGKFYSLLASKCNCHSYVVEASPLLYKKLPIFEKTKFFNYAIGNFDGPVTFFLSNNPETNSLDNNVAKTGGNINATTVQGISFENFLKNASISSKIDVLKIDIEGAELAVLENISSNTLNIISQIAVEFHDFIIKTSDYLNRMNLSLKKLRENHFLILKISNSDWREVLVLNTRHMNLNIAQKIRLRVIHPFLHTLMTIHRKLGFLKAAVSSKF